MKLKLPIFMLALFLCITESAGNSGDSYDYPRFTFGAEWSYSATLFYGHRLYYIAPETGRVDDRNDSFTYMTDGEAYLHAGYNINNLWNISLYFGYIGIGEFHSGISGSLRATRYFGNIPSADRWFAYCDVGSGFSIKDIPEEIFTAKAGGGYRISLSRFTKLDFLVSLRCVYTHPDIYFYGEKIRNEDIGRNIGYLSSISFGICITF